MLDFTRDFRLMHRHGGDYEPIDWPFTEQKACQKCWLTPEWA